jgi:hypothetical protein
VFKRVRWMSMGAAAGVGASVWAQYRLRRTLDQHPSARVSLQAAAKARRLGLEVREAILDGRDAMVAREEALRAELDARLVPIRPEDTSDGVARRPLRRRSDRRDDDPQPGTDGVRSGTDGARLRIVDASSERLGAPAPNADHQSLFAGHPSLGAGGPSSLDAGTDSRPPIDQDSSLPPRSGRSRRRRDS